MEVSLQLKFSVQQTVRTPHSWRVLLAQENGQEAALLEAHQEADGKVSGTLVVFEGGPLTREDVPEFLAQVTDMLLPDHPETTFTVISGRILGVCGTQA